MRKRLKNKRGSSCGICKPGKNKQSNRWTPKYFGKLREWERRQADPDWRERRP